MAWRYRRRLILVYLSIVGGVAFSLVVPWLLGDFVDRIFVVDEGILRPAFDLSQMTLVWIGLGLLGASLMRGLFEFAANYTSDSLSQMVAFDVRNSFYDKLQHLSFAFHDKEHTGDIMSKATADVEAVRRYVHMGMARSLEVFLRIVAITAVLAYLNWELTLISLAFVPFLVLRSTMVVGKMRRLWLHVQEIMGQQVTILQENLAGMQVVKAFAAEEHEKKKYAKKAQELRREFFESERLQGTNSAWMTLYFTLAMGLILWYGGWEVIRGDLTPGGLTAFLLYMGLLNLPIRMTAFILNTYSRAISSGQRLFDVLDAQSPVEERTGAADSGRARGHVRFDDVSFSYDRHAPGLRHVNVSVPPGSVVALLGAPGSGKTTVVNLLPRFYDVTEGQITIDGVDTRDYTLASLRRNVGIVQQDVFLFSATIKSNIAYGVQDASFDQIVEAAKIAQLHDHIVSLPGGYDTWVGERGATLSGGQRQRLAIARTLLIDPPVLIFDDSTSSVDVETERQIHKAMAQVMKGRTTFVIAHRLSTVREADLILVMKDGEIVERGSHTELMAYQGIYRGIYELQLRPQEEYMLDAGLGAELLPHQALATGDGGDS